MRNSPFPTTLKAVLAFFVLQILLLSSAYAAEFVVDRNDDDPTASACTSAAGDCSLRGAIAAAEAVSTDDSIVFDAAVFSANPVILLDNGTLNVLGNGRLSIDGSSARFITIDGQGASGSGIFYVEASGQLSVSNLTLTGGKRDLQPGGAVENRGVFSLSYSTVTGNQGGAGGAIYNIAGNVTIDNSTICFNQSAYGTVMSVGTSAVTVIRDSSIVSNTATFGGGVYVSSGSVSIGNTIVANNSAPTGPDIFQNVNSLGYNLIGNSSGTTVTGDANGNQMDLDPLLDPTGLADHGGNSLTIALLAGSPALDTGNSFATDDQRNEPRPVDDPDSPDGSGNRADIGAFEFQPSAGDPDPDPVPVYNFGGFQKPIDPEAPNRRKGGSVVPVRFSLGGFFGYDFFADGYPSSVEVDCSSGDVVGDPQPVSYPGGSGLTYEESSMSYSFKWKTRNDWQGTCRNLLVGLDDGTVFSAYFVFK